jgi:hypothetical protein
VVARRDRAAVTETGDHSLEVTDAGGRVAVEGETDAAAMASRDL